MSLRPWSILTGDCIEMLATITEQSVDCCVTSPPYWGLRDYGVDGQIGLEGTPEGYVAKLVDVFRAARRALKDDGALWLNLGDSYAKAIPGGLKPKDLVGIPWRVAFALQADGWWLRSDIIWSKPNPMPESVTDRPSRSHEYVFLLAKSERYFYDADSIREPVSESSIERWGNDPYSKRRPNGRPTFAKIGGETMCGTNPLGRNARTVWPIAAEPFEEAHFAVFPQELARRCILAGSRKGGLVLDPFGGSMTTGVVAVKHERRFVGIDIKPEYVAMGERRIEIECPNLLWAMSDQTGAANAG